MKNIAIFMDIENITKAINIQDMMEDISIQYSKETNEDKVNFCFKVAVGNEESIKSFSNQLKNLNFEIRNAPKVAKLKNRADLIISLDAFEKLYLNNPSIDLFVFLTSDSDYSIVMDKLQRYNKDVWLVAKEEDAQRGVFQSSASKILPITNYIQKDNNNNKDKDLNFKEFFKIDSVSDVKAIKAILKVFKSYDLETVYTKSFTNNQFRKIENTLDLEKTKFKKFNGIYKLLIEKNIIKLAKPNGNGSFRLLDKSSISKYLV